MDSEIKNYILQRISFLQKEMDDLEKILSGTAPDTPEYDRHYAQREEYRKELKDWIITLNGQDMEQKKLELEQQRVDNDRNFKNGQLKNEKKSMWLRIGASTLQTGFITAFCAWMADYENSKERLITSKPIQTAMKFLNINKII